MPSATAAAGFHADVHMLPCRLFFFFAEGQSPAIRRCAYMPVIFRFAFHHRYRHHAGFQRYSFFMPPRRLSATAITLQVAVFVRFLAHAF